VPLVPLKISVDPLLDDESAQTNTHADSELCRYLLRNNSFSQYTGGENFGESRRIIVYYDESKH